MPQARATEGSRRRTTVSFALASMLLLAMLETSACFYVDTHPPPLPPTPIPGWSADNFQAHKMIEALAERDRRLVSVQSSAVMEYKAGDTEHLKIREEIAARRPGSLRVEAMSTFGVALLLAAQGTDLAIYEPGQNRFMRGAATADTLYRFVRIPMAPTDAVGLLMGLAPAQFDLTSTPNSVSNDGTTLVATFGNAAAGTRELGFSGGNLALVRETAAGGQVNCEVRYTEYHDIGGVMFPYLVDATFPSAGSHVTFRYIRPIVNGDLPDSTFVLTPVPGATLMNLSFDAPGTFSNES